MPSHMVDVVLNGELVGLVSCRREEREKLSHAAVLGLSVLKAQWGRGLGRALTKAMILEAKNIGISRIELRVREDNGAAIALYESFGFQQEGRLRRAFRVDARFFDEYIMGLLLD